MKILKILFWTYLSLMVWPHELLHYGTARIRGVEARLQTFRVLVRETTDINLLLITLAPAVAGLIMLAFCTVCWVLLAHSSREGLFWWTGVSYWGCWMGTCGHDLWQVWHFLRTGEWPDRGDFPFRSRRAFTWKQAVEIVNSLRYAKRIKAALSRCCLAIAKAVIGSYRTWTHIAISAL